MAGLPRYDAGIDFKDEKGLLNVKTRVIRVH
jgi:hypothetical protein